MHHRQNPLESRLDSSGLVYWPVAGLCEHGNKPCGYDAENFLTSWATISFSRKVVLRGIIWRLLTFIMLPWTLNVYSCLEPISAPLSWPTCGWSTCIATQFVAQSVVTYHSTSAKCRNSRPLRKLLSYSMWDELSLYLNCAIRKYFKLMLSLYFCDVIPCNLVEIYWCFGKITVSFRTDK
jgi:hypothetical protein